MFIILILLWLMFNGRFALDVLISGVLISAAVEWFAVTFCRWDVAKELAWLKVIPRMLAYAGLLVKEIVVANLQVIRLILDPKLEEKIHPQMVRFPVGLKTSFTRMLLANSITLTPGTITVRLHPDTFVVHALTPDMGKDLEHCSFAVACAGLDEAICTANRKKEDDHVS
jgi:multicomponent Na+:H+ antiporter subunit E